MTPETFIEHFETFAEAPNGVEKLRELILQLAVQGKLGTQDGNDEPAEVLLPRIREERIKRYGVNRATSAEGGASTNGPFSLPPNWCWVPLASVLLKLTDGTHRSPPNGPSGDFKYISAKNIRQPGVDLGNVTYISATHHAEIFGRCDPDLGDVLYVKDGATTGNVTINDLDEPFSLLSSVALLKVPRALSNRYLLHVLRSPFFYDSMRGDMTGVAITRVTLGKMERAMIPLPPLAEQRRIVAKVDQLLGLCDELAARQAARREARSALVGATLDRLVSARESAEFPAHAHRLRDHFDRLFDTPTTIPQLRQAILQLAIQGKLVPQDPNDEPVEKHLTKVDRQKGKWAVPIDEQELPFQLPSSWMWFRLGDVSTLKHGYAFSSTFFTSEPAQFVLTTPGNFYEKGGFRDRESKRKYYSGPVEPEFILQPGDLIIPMTEQAAGLLGSPAFIPNDGRIYIHNQRLGKLSFSESVVPEFAFWFFNGDFFRGELARTCTGMKVRHTSPDRVLRVPFPVPPLAEQKRIVSQVTELLSLCDALEAKLTQADSASTQLLSAAVSHLLTGQRQ